MPLLLQATYAGLLLLFLGSLHQVMPSRAAERLRGRVLGHWFFARDAAWLGTLVWVGLVDLALKLQRASPPKQTNEWNAFPKQKLGTNNLEFLLIRVTHETPEANHKNTM